MNLTNQSSPSCSILSASLGEPLIATVPQTKIYCLVEYYGEWSDKALEKSDIAANVKIYLQEMTNAHGPGKTLLIKQGADKQISIRHFFVAIVSEEAPRLYQFDLSSYEEIMSIDLEGLINGTTGATEYLSSQRIYLVCTNGRRDRCCAKEGIPVYKSLRAQVGDAAWECSHVGGHRFAANVITLPDGVFYGRMRPEMVPDLVDACNNSRVIPEWMRGRTIYPAHIQAAESFLRKKTNRKEIFAYRLEDSRELENDRWEVSFIEISSGIGFTLRVHKIRTEEAVFESCSQDKSTTIIHYELESI